jgi:hypothetical protein
MWKEKDRGGGAAGDEAEDGLMVSQFIRIGQLEQEAHASKQHVEKCSGAEQ